MSEICRTFKKNFASKKKKIETFKKKVGTSKKIYNADENLNPSRICERFVSTKIQLATLKIKNLFSKIIMHTFYKISLEEFAIENLLKHPQHDMAEK